VQTVKENFLLPEYASREKIAKAAFFPASGDSSPSTGDAVNVSGTLRDLFTQADVSGKLRIKIARGWLKK